MSFNEDPIDVYHSRASQIKAMKNVQMHGSSTLQQSPGFVDYYDVQYPRNQGNDQSDIRTMPQLSRSRKPAVQDIEDENGYTLANPTESWSNDIRNEENRETKATEIKGKCSCTKTLNVIAILVLLLALFGLGGFFFYRHMNDEGKEVQPKRISTLIKQIGK